MHTIKSFINIHTSLSSHQNYQHSIHCLKLRNMDVYEISHFIALLKIIHSQLYFWYAPVQLHLSSFSITNIQSNQ